MATRPREGQGPSRLSVLHLPAVLQCALYLWEKFSQRMEPIRLCISYIKMESWVWLYFSEVWKVFILK